MAETMADTVTATSTRPDGTVISPMRLAEAQLTKAVLAARDGSPVTALELAETALNHERRSQPEPAAGRQRGCPRARVPLPRRRRRVPQPSP